VLDLGVKAKTSKSNQKTDWNHRQLKISSRVPKILWRTLTMTSSLLIRAWGYLKSLLKEVIWKLKLQCRASHPGLRPHLSLIRSQISRRNCKSSLIGSIKRANLTDVVSPPSCRLRTWQILCLKKGSSLTITLAPSTSCRVSAWSSKNPAPKLLYQ